MSLPESVLRTAVFLAALGSGLMGGLFFVFSNTIMRALAALPEGQGAAAMQSINRVIQNPLFFVVFFGTAALSLLLVLQALLAWQPPRSAWLLAGGLAYFIGNIMVTMLCNVPRNIALDRLDPASAEGRRYWPDYLAGWTRWNHLRTLTAILAAACFMRALA